MIKVSHLFIHLLSKTTILQHSPLFTSLFTKTLISIINWRLIQNQLFLRNSPQNQLRLGISPKNKLFYPQTTDITSYSSEQNFNFRLTNKISLTYGDIKIKTIILKENNKFKIYSKRANFWKINNSYQSIFMIIRLANKYFTKWELEATNFTAPYSSQFKMND